MYRLHGAPGRASAAPEAVLEELAALHGVRYEFIDTDADARKSPAYLALNPFGQLPTLVDGDRVVWESAAICIYLCDRHPEAALAPRPDAPTRGTFLQWMFYLSNTLQPAYMMFIYADRYTTDAAGADGIKAAAAKRVAAAWRALEDGLSPGPFLCGEQLTAADMYLYMLSTWHRESIVPLARFPRVRRALDLVDARPGIQTMMLRNRGH